MSLTSLASQALVLMAAVATLWRAQLAACQTADSLECYSCSSSKDLTRCLATSQACRGASQACFKAEMLGVRGVTEVYSMGCMDAAECQRMPQSSARDLCARQGQVCYSCCSDRSFCNAAGATVWKWCWPLLLLLLVKQLIDYGAGLLQL